MDPADIKTVLMGEFAAMRSEITTFIALEVQFLTASVALAGVLVGFAVHDWESFRRVFAVVPIPFAVLGLLYADTKARVQRAARYIHTVLRKEVQDAGSERALRWEDYIRSQYQNKAYLEVFEWLRWLIFVGPAGVALYFSLREPHTLNWSKNFYRFLIGADLALIVAVLLAAIMLATFDRGIARDERTAGTVLPPPKSEQAEVGTTGDQGKARAHTSAGR
jgi:hypothetical protein